MSDLAFTVPSELVERIAERAAEILLERGGRDEQAEWLTSREAAEYLRCGVGRIHNLASEGRIPRHKEGGRLLFRRSELDDYVTGGLQSV